LTVEERGYPGKSDMSRFTIFKSGKTGKKPEHAADTRERLIWRGGKIYKLFSYETPLEGKRRHEGPKIKKETN